MVGEVGLEPTKAKPADLQSAPFAARDTPPSQDGVSILLLGRIRLGFSCQKTGWQILMTAGKRIAPEEDCGGRILVNCDALSIES